MQNSPWWGIPVLSGLFVFVGVVVAQGVAIWLDRRKTVRENQRRWDNERRQAYVKYLSHLAKQTHTRANGDNWSDEDALQYLEALTEVTLLGSPPVVTVFNRSADFLLDTSPREGNDWTVGHAEHRSEIVAAVRDELGITESSRKIVLDTSFAGGLAIQALKVSLGAVGTAFAEGLKLMFPFRIVRSKR